MALYAVVFLGSTPIGGPIVGWVGEHVSPRASLYLGAASALGAGVAWRSRLDGPSFPEPPPPRLPSWETARG